MTHIIRQLLQQIGEDPDREGLRETPERVMDAWREWTSGYGKDPADILKTFDGGNYEEMVFQGALPFFSLCVAGSTFVETPKGRVPIQYLKDGDWVYAINDKTLEVHLVKCKHPRVTRKKAKLVRVYTDNDTVLCTPDHKFLTFNRGWVEAKSLIAGDSIVSIYRSLIDKLGHVALVGLRRGKESLAGKVYFSNKTYVPEHRFVWYDLMGEWFYRRPIHHLNEVAWDNLPINLDPLTISQHNKIHQRLVDANTYGTEKFAKRKALAAAGNRRPDVRAKKSVTLKKYWKNLKSNPQAYKDRCEKMSAGIQASREANHKVIGVEAVPWKEDVWCMDIPRYNSFFANGMAVHNCEHHLAQFWGLAHIAYIPNGRIVGLSKLGRLTEIYARRLQVQERMTHQIAEALMIHLNCRGAAVVTQARHGCMESRGIQKIGTVTVCSAVRGLFKDRPEVRAEFMSLCQTAMAGIKFL